MKDCTSTNGCVCSVRATAIVLTTRIVGNKTLEEKKQSKLEKWRKKYGSLAVALGCLYSLIVTWGEGWFFTAIMILGVCICGTFAIFDLKNSTYNRIG